jgi:LPXTG-motif cell wall-anchored protein
MKTIIKRILCITVVLIMIYCIGITCFAETVDNSTYQEKKDKVAADDALANIDEPIPKGTVLPSTGGIPSEAFYIAGGLLIVGSLVILKLKPKSVTKS